MAKRTRSRKETILIIVEGKSEERLFKYLEYSNLIPPYYALTIDCAGGGSNPMERVCERALQLKKQHEKSSPYKYVFAVFDTDRMKKEKKAAAYTEQGICLLKTPIRFENALLDCIGEKVSETMPSEMVKKTFKNIFGTDGACLKWQSCGTFGITPEKLKSCPVLKDFWDRLGPCRYTSSTQPKNLELPLS